MNRPPRQAKISDRRPKWEAKTRDVSAASLVSWALKACQSARRVQMSVTLEATTLPIFGQTKKSALGAMKVRCNAMPYVAGIYEGRRLVRSKFESQEVGETFLLQFHPDSSDGLTKEIANRVEL